MMTKIFICAAGLLAQELHKGQVDKGGNDYFESHLLSVASKGSDWKEIVVGFLHDAAEDCDVTVDEVTDRLIQKSVQVINDPREDWNQDWMDMFDIPKELVVEMMDSSEFDEISKALNALNHHTAPSRNAYIKRIAEIPLATKVKLHDLESNMDLGRIPTLSTKDITRVARYQKEHDFLKSSLNK